MRDSDRRALVSFHSDNEARVSDFFDAYAAELPPDMSARFRAYGSQFTRRHARVTLSSLFKLFRAQCNKVIADVHKELGFEDEDEDAIRESIEDAAGFEFQSPLSAALVSTGQHKRNERSIWPGSDPCHSDSRRMKSWRPSCHRGSLIP